MRVRPAQMFRVDVTNPLTGEEHHGFETRLDWAIALASSSHDGGTTPCPRIYELDVVTFFPIRQVEWRS